VGTLALEFSDEQTKGVLSFANGIIAELRSGLTNKDQPTEILIPLKKSFSVGTSIRQTTCRLVDSARATALVYRPSLVTPKEMRHFKRCGPCCARLEFAQLTQTHPSQTHLKLYARRAKRSKKHTDYNYRILSTHIRRTGCEACRNWLKLAPLKPPKSKR